MCKSLGKKSPNGKILENDIDFCDYLLTEFRVNTVPGSGFGKPGFIRISYATDEESLQEAMVRIKEACNSLKDI